MLEKKISRLIVKNQNEEAVGIISFRDLFRIAIELGSEEDDSGYGIQIKLDRDSFQKKGLEIFH